MDSPVRDDEQAHPVPDAPESHVSDEDDAVGAGFKPAPTEEPASEPQPVPRADRRLAEIISRVDVLTAAIERYPDSPVNYVLRGEALLEGGDNDLAAEDFVKALELAEPRAETANWGYISRALADRARDGLRRART
ncbi:MAG: hypothetical protein IT324_00390 [Anaerolineae bacterium]|nr:hypothetical protein [Anaerolineae bacterium]